MKEEILNFITGDLGMEVDTYYNDNGQLEVQLRTHEKVSGSDIEAMISFLSNISYTVSVYAIDKYKMALMFCPI